MSAGPAPSDDDGAPTHPAAEADLAVAAFAALRTGPGVMRRFGRDATVEYKAPDQPLTEADLEADRALAGVLRGARPEYGWLSEETADRPDRLRRDRVWIVDPIDGTRSFIAGVPGFAISVGLAQAGVAALGAVYNPAVGELYWAARGGGAYMAAIPEPGRPVDRTRAPDRLQDALDAVGASRARRLAVTRRSEPKDAVLLASRTEIARGEFEPFRGRWRVEPEGSTAYKMARIAAGGADAFLSRGPKSEWDICASAVIVEEAGGRVTDLDGRALGFNRPDPYVHGIVVSNGPLHAPLLARARSLPSTGRLRARRPRDDGDERQSDRRGG